MGTCWPKPVNNLSSTTKFSRPANDNSKVRNNKNHPNNNDTHQIGRLSAADPNRNLGREGGGGGGDGGGKDVPPSGKIITPNLKMFTLAQLQFATRNFRPDSVLGEGGFGTVYKGWIDEKTYAPSKVDVGMPVAVKKSNPDSEQGLKEWQAEVKFLGKFSHPNLVKLLGYCWEDKHFLLVYEYMQKGSLETHLFRKDAAEPFSWDTRMKIALGAACGLAFLHTTEKQVIYRDFKAANILLDRELNAKLSDFGLAKLGPVDGKSHVTTNIVGTYGYAAPEYLATGHLYLKSDVYGFGVVLLEIITGKRVLDPNRPNGQINLVDWARPFLFDIKKSRKIMDPRLENKYPSKAAFQITQLILKCVDSDQKCRPGMEEVLETLKRISTIKTKPKECKIKPRRDQQPGNHQHFHTTPRHVHHGGGRAGPCDNVIAAGPGFIDRFG